MAECLGHVGISDSNDATLTAICRMKTVRFITAKTLTALAKYDGIFSGSIALQFPHIAADGAEEQFHFSSPFGRMLLM